MHPLVLVWVQLHFVIQHLSAVQYGRVVSVQYLADFAERHLRVVPQQVCQALAGLTDVPDAAVASQLSIGHLRVADDEVQVVFNVRVHIEMLEGQRLRG